MKLSKPTGALMVALVFTTAACGVKSTTTDVNPRVNRAPTCADAIEVYASRSRVPHDYYELAFIEASGNSVYTSDGQIEKIIRNRAAEVGANAVIVSPVTESGATIKVIGEALGTRSATAKAAALAIYMPADAGRVTQKCGNR